LTDSPTKLGILAGRGDLPLRIVAHCRRIARPFFVVAFKDQADTDAFRDVPHTWVRLGAAGSALTALRENGVEEVVFAGGIKRPSLAALRPDARALKFFSKLGPAALGDDGLLRAIVATLEQEEGVRVVGVDQIIGGLTVAAGTLGAHAPDAEAGRDVDRGIDVLTALGTCDVGQAVVVQDGLVLGIEAVEGTDALLDRCGALRREGRGGVLVKLAKTGQETRVDLPTIGPETVRRARDAGLQGIAVHAGRTLVVDRDDAVALADAAGVFVVAVDP